MMPKSTIINKILGFTPLIIMTFLVTKQASIDLEPDKNIWTNSLDGFLSSKEAYQHLKISSNATFFGASLFGLGLPFLFDPMLWRLIHNEMAADEHLWSKDFVIVSTYNLCLLI